VRSHEVRRHRESINCCGSQAFGERTASRFDASVLRAPFVFPEFYNTCAEVDALIAALWFLRQARNPGLA